MRPMEGETVEGKAKAVNFEPQHIGHTRRMAEVRENCEENAVRENILKTN